MIAEPGCKGANVTQIIFDGAGAALFAVQIGLIGKDGFFCDAGRDHDVSPLILFFSILPSARAHAKKPAGAGDPTSASFCVKCKNRRAVFRSWAVFAWQTLTRRLVFCLFL